MFEINLNIVPKSSLPVKQKENISNSGFSPRLKQINCDTVSFGALKKSKLEEFSLAAANMFKAPLQNFNSPQDMQDWSKTKLKKLLNLEKYSIEPHNNLRDEVIETTNNERMQRLNEWKKYITKDNDVIKEDPSMGLIIFSAITKNLKSNNRELPPVLDQRALVDTIDKVSKKLKQKENSQFNFLKLYEFNLIKGLSGLANEDVSGVAGKVSGWVKIPSKKQDSENFDENVKKLKALSCNSWCTKSDKFARNYLKKGDFHAFLDNGKTKAGIRFDDNKIVEIQGVKNNGKIPLDYFDEIKNYMSENNYNDYSYNLEEEMEKIEETNFNLRVMRLEIQDFTGKRKHTSKKDYQYILRKHGIQSREIDDDMLRLTEYKKPKKGYNYADVGMNENDLFKHVKEIALDGNFSGTQVTNLGNLEKIGSNAYFTNSQVKDLGKLKEISRDVFISRNSTLDFSNVKIGGDIIRSIAY